MAQKPSLPKGTRDFLPQVMLKRNYIFSTIRKAFVKYGYDAIETPAMEKTETLLGKYGEEGDRLIFKIFPRGKKIGVTINNIGRITQDTITLSEFNADAMEDIIANETEEALRYDLTVPFARFVVQNQNELSFPFKRYQIQPVWRADRPQKGRYREFYQCDADVVGSDSLLYEVELVQLFDEVLTSLGLPDFTIKLNNRKLLSGLAEITGIEDKLVDMTVAIDKLDKIGKDGVVKELLEREIPQTAIDKISPLFELGIDNDANLNLIEDLLKESEVGQKGVEELRFVLDSIKSLGLKSAKLELDLTLARGLNYYTGAIFEVKANGVKMGSICGGGRYDDLTGIFGMSGMSGVGISFGADRIFDVMEELDLFPDLSQDATQLLITYFGTEEQSYCMSKLKLVREANINAEIYPDAAKMKKQMKYANDKNIPFVAVVGGNEVAENKVSLKNMETGEQALLSWDELIKTITG